MTVEFTCCWCGWKFVRDEPRRHMGYNSYLEVPSKHKDITDHVKCPRCSMTIESTPNHRVEHIERGKRKLARWKYKK